MSRVRDQSDLAVWFAWSLQQFQLTRSLLIYSFGEIKNEEETSNETLPPIQSPTSSHLWPFEAPFFAPFLSLFVPGKVELLEHLPLASLQPPLWSWAEEHCHMVAAPLWVRQILELNYELTQKRLGSNYTPGTCRRKDVLPV